MRIAQISTLASPVCQHAHGSVESLVWLMTRELARRGHQVTVFGVAGSQVDGEAVATVPGPYGENNSLEDWHLCEWVNLCEAVKQSRRFDVMHSHAYLWGLPIEGISEAPMVHTMHIIPEEDPARLWRPIPARVSRLFHGINGAHFPSFSQPRSFRMEWTLPSLPSDRRRKITSATWAVSNRSRGRARRSPPRVARAFVC